MPITAKELREKRAKLVKGARAILDKADAEKREPTAEERSAWDKIMGGTNPEGVRIEGEEEKLKKQIDQIERQEAAESELRSNPGQQPGREDGPAQDGEPEKRGPSEEMRTLALQAWIRRECRKELTDQQQQALQVCKPKTDRGELLIGLRRDDYRTLRRDMRKFNNGDLESRAGSNAAQSALITTSGAYTIPEGFVNNLEAALLQYGGVREVADVMRTTGGGDLPWPTVNDTTVKGAILPENTAVSTGDVTFGALVLHAHKYYSKIVLVPVELIEDSAFNLQSFLADALGTRIARIQADHFTTGTGTGQPNGIITAATLGVTGASTSAIIADEIYGLEHSIDPAYRKTGCVWSMHDSILLIIKKLKDGMGRYLWQASLAGGNPDTIAGYGVNINQSMDNTVASGKKTMLFGQHTKYKIRDVAEVRLRRLVERYADQDQEGFVMFMRSDANLLDAGTHPLKYMTH